MCREEYPGQPLPTLGSLFLPWATSSYPGLPLPVKAGLPLTVKAGLPLTVKAGFPWCQSRLPVVSEQASRGPFTEESYPREAYS